MPTRLCDGSDEDAVLVVRTRAGDPAAFEELVLRYEPLADAYARTILEDADVVEDLVQDAFVRAFTALRTLEHPERFGAWLKSILWRRCRDWVRAQCARPDRALAQPGIAAAELGDAAAEEGEDAPWLARLAAAVEAMGTDHRAVMALFYILDEPQERIARFLDVPLGTVKRRLHTGRSRVAAALPAEPLDMAGRRRFVERLRHLLATSLPPTPTETT